MNGNLKKLRKSKGFKQKEMAKLLGYTISSYNKIENGERGMSLIRAIKATELLNCSLDEIFLPSNFPK